MHKPVFKLYKIYLHINQPGSGGIGFMQEKLCKSAALPVVRFGKLSTWALRRRASKYATCNYCYNVAKIIVWIKRQ